MSQVYPMLFLEAFQFLAIILLGFRFLDSLKTSKFKCRKLKFKNIADQTVQILSCCAPKVKKSIWSLFILGFMDS